MLILRIFSTHLVLFDFIAYSCGSVMFNNHTIWCHPEEVGSLLSLVALKVSSSSHLRDLPLSTLKAHYRSKFKTIHCNPTVINSLGDIQIVHSTKNFIILKWTY